MEAILFDFDGVLLNSNEVRDLGFEKVLIDFPKNQVDKLLEFHKANGGLSRYVKFRYFFNEIKGEPISDNRLSELTDQFSTIMRKMLVDSTLLIEETIGFVQKEYGNTDMHIVSGSDQDELRFLCNSLKISQYFKSINGSPTPKIELVKKILEQEDYKGKCVLIGDSINDYEAANMNGIEFMGYNNSEVESFSTIKINLSQ